MVSEHGFNGEPYIKIINLLFGAIVNSKDLLTNEGKIFMVILFKTIGFQKEKDWLTWKQIKNLTGIKHHSHIYRAIKKLKDKNLITKDGKYFKVNQNFEEWLTLDKENINSVKELYQCKKLRNSVTNDNENVPNMVHTDSKNVPNTVQECTKSGTSKIPNMVHPSTDKTITDKTITDNKDIYSRDDRDDPVSDFFAKEKNKELNKELKEQIEEIFNHWNYKNIITHRKLTDKVKGKINAKLKEGYSKEEVKQAVVIYCLLNLFYAVAFF